jgi:hypothetical protein
LAEILTSEKAKFKTKFKTKIQFKVIQNIEFQDGRQDSIIPSRNSLPQTH